jgi:hypothetical protein
MPSPTDMEYWPPRAEYRVFDWSQPTCEAYKLDDTESFSEPFRKSRSKLDYSYHKNPILDRQVYQDMVLSRILEAYCDEGEEFSPFAMESLSTFTPHRPFLVFMSGPMGVGKSYVLTQLHQRGIFPLEKCVKIDPDMLKCELPEMAGYLQHDSESAATKLHRESTLMSDVLFEQSLMNNRNILVDGSLRDADWYQTLFKRIRTEFPHYMLSIMYVSASSQTIKDRAHQRAVKTDRTVPERLLQESIDQVPLSLQALSPLTEYTFEITNDDGQPMTLKQWPSKDGGDGIDNHKSELSWQAFRRIWHPSSEEGAIAKEETKDGSSLPLLCQMMEKLSCPIQSVNEFQCAKTIWGKAYPSFCPRCTLFSDHQCT